MTKFASLILLLPVVAGLPAAAQGLENSGNGLLKGTYYFRQVVWHLAQAADGSLDEAVSLYGNMVFDGAGNYTINNTQIFDSGGNGTPQNYTTSGTYTISASGYGSLSSPLNSAFSLQDTVYGLVSQNIFIASSSENGSGYNDLFVAALMPSPQPTNASFNGTYNMVGLDYPDGQILDTRQSTFALHPDGNGSVGTVQVTGYIAGRGSSVITQSISRVPYRTSNGAYVVTFGGSLSSSNLIAGTKYLYSSPDGNFVFGGDPQAWDMILGVRQGSAAVNFSGLYYQAGAAVYNGGLSSGAAPLETQYGSLNNTSGTILGHQRLLDLIDAGASYDYTYADAASANSNGAYSDCCNQYFFGAGGAVGVGTGALPFFGVVALLQAPSFSGTGPYLFPNGILNAGSSVPFTASWAPGELVSIYGTNLTSTTTSDVSLPVKLGGVQVMVNGIAAPVYGVAHTASYDQINAIIPLSTNTTVASIQVITDSGKSNTISNFVDSTQPGVFYSFTSSPAVQHGVDYSPVNSVHPAQSGETLVIYLTGLGTLDSSGNVTNLSKMAVYFSSSDGSTQTQANIAGAVSQPSVGGGYQMNVVVPSGLKAGTYFLDIAGPDSYNSQVAIPVGTGSAPAHSLRDNARVGRPIPERGAGLRLAPSRRAN